MKNIKKITALIGLTILGISTANAGVYIGADTGYSKVRTGNVHYNQKRNNTSIPPISGVIDSSQKNRDLESINFGYAVNNKLRTEIALTRYGNINNSYVITNTQRRSAERADINRRLKSRSLTVNAYYDFNTTSQMQPYVMAGIGLGIHKTGFEVLVTKTDKTVEVNNSNSTKNVFAYQVGAGTSYKITNQWYADAGVKYAYLGKSSTDNTRISQRAKISSVGATVGIRYAF